MLGVTWPKPESLVVTGDVETTTASVTLMGPGLVTGLPLFGVSLSGEIGNTKLSMVLETRAETVVRLGSGEVESLCGMVEEVELATETLELVAVS